MLSFCCRYSPLHNQWYRRLRILSAISSDDGKSIMSIEKLANYRLPDDDKVCADDLNLVSSIFCGSITAWRRFVTDYSGLIYIVIRRHLPAEDNDCIRTLSVNILKQLYQSDLQKYHGRSTLSTWLFVYVARKALDYWRAQHGRYRQPKGFEELSNLDREVLRLYYIEKMPLDIVVHTLNWNGKKITAYDIVEAIERIESTLDPRFLKRLDEEYQVRKNNVASRRLLQYMIHARLEYERHIDDNEPDRDLLEQEARQTSEKIQALLSELPELDRKIIDLKFSKRLPANQISDKLALGGQRKVYTIIDRVLRKLRTSLSD